MRTMHLLLVLAAATMVAGCATMSTQRISGLWNASLWDNAMLIQLDRNEHWSWWNLQDAPPPAPPTQEGRWFVHDSILVLRVEKSASCKLPTGLAFTFDLRNATTNRITLYDWQTEKEIAWERIANKVPQVIVAPAPKPEH